MIKLHCQLITEINISCWLIKLMQIQRNKCLKFNLMRGKLKRDSKIYKDFNCSYNLSMKIVSASSIMIKVIWFKMIQRRKLS